MEVAEDNRGLTPPGGAAKDMLEEDEELRRTCLADVTTTRQGGEDDRSLLSFISVSNEKSAAEGSEDVDDMPCNRLDINADAVDRGEPCEQRPVPKDPAVV